MRNVSEKVGEKIKTHILCSVSSFSENDAVREIMWQNMVQPDRSQTEVLYSAEKMKEWARTHARTHNIYYFLLFHCSSGYVEVPECYTVCTLPVLLPCSL